MNLLKLIFSKVFLINIALAALFLGGVAWGSLQALNAYTDHGETITVPDLRGLTVKQVERLLKNKHLKYVTHDSTFVVEKAPHVVLDQDPEPKSKVKENRKIYLTVNANNPPKVEMPDLHDKSLRQAKMELAGKGLKVGELIYKPDLAQNAVLEQKHKEKDVKPGKEISKGSEIDLVLGDGLGKTKVKVPKLVGLTYEEARFNLIGNSLNVGAVIPDETVTDTMTAQVVRQVPSYKDGEQLNLGESVDLYLSQEMKDAAEPSPDTATSSSNQTHIDSLIEEQSQ